jgi:AraC family transcriptional regulator, regulatory protein of adaptative response / methylated-DNA-[protein]-cysteine methyltransferase
MRASRPFLDQLEFARIARAIGYIDANGDGTPSLAGIARAAQCSPPQLSRLFRRWAGISPQRYLELISQLPAMASREGRHAVLEAALNTEPPASGRPATLHIEVELAGAAEASRADLQIDYGLAPSPFGLMLVGMNAKRLCFLGFTDSGSRYAAQATLRAHWPRAALQWRPEVASGLANCLWPAKPGAAQPARLKLWLSGTGFQLSVWQALLAFGGGEYCAYGELAARVHRPGGARAVGGAVGANPVSWLIPCHRVLGRGGALGGYGGGESRKLAMLAWEHIQGRRAA